LTAQAGQKIDATAQQLHHELGQVGVVPTGLPWVAFSGGRTNRIWKIGSCDGAFVCKLYHRDAGTILFPNDVLAEENALRFLQDRDIAPELISTHQSSLGPCLVYRHVPGQLWHGEVSVVGEKLSELHSLPTPILGFRTLDAGASSILQTGAEILGKCTSSDAISLAKMAPPAIDLSDTPAVFLHGDLVPGNIVINGTDVRFIDWQCPAIGDATEDIAIFLSPAMQVLYGHRALTGDETDEFFAAYSDAGVQDRYYKLKPFYHWRMATHCLWKAEQGQHDYWQALQLEIAALEQC
jgi:thiamine kinase